MNRLMSNAVIFLLLLSTLSVIGCKTTEIKTTEQIPVVHETADIPENELLDIGIRIFDPGLENLEQLDDDTLVFPEIRIAEASFFPYLLMETLQSSGAWGAVRVVPTGHDSVDVLVKGDIIQSDGEQLIVLVDVVDSRGHHWFNKEYAQKASRYSYDKKNQLRYEPFQNIYNRISNDLNKYRKSLTSQQLVELRLVSELKFAKDFSPQTFSEHLSKDESGYYLINRLPAENDPMLARIKQIRERDYLFVDTLQEYYSSYAKEMKAPYKQWRSESYNEVIAMRKMKEKALNQKMIGAAAIIAGIYGAGSSTGSARAASSVAVAGGAYVLKDGFDRDADAQIHIEALQELGDSLQASIESQVIELEDRTVTLSGTVDNQYLQWKKILQEIYQSETGN